MFNFSKLFKKRGEKEIIWGEDNAGFEEQKSKKEQTAKEENSLGFLSNLAMVAGESERTPTETESMTPQRKESIEKRIGRLIERIELLERKIERIENKLNLSY